MVSAVDSSTAPVAVTTGSTASAPAPAVDGDSTGETKACGGSSRDRGDVSDENAEELDGGDVPTRTTPQLSL